MLHYILQHILPLAHLSPSRVDPTSPAPPPLTEYPDTFYTRTVSEPLLLAPTRLPAPSIDADVCVVGGGLAGISTALGLVERGCSVVLLEASRVAAAASGMNGGMVIPGFALDSDVLIARVGEERARVLHTWTLEAMKLMRTRIERHRIDCSLEQCGMVTLSLRAGAEAEERVRIKKVNAVLGTQLELWPAQRVREVYRSPLYHHATLDPSVWSVHPLNLCLGLARVFVSQGGHVFEKTRAVSIINNPCASSEGAQSGKHRRWLVGTESADGSRSNVQADHVVLAVGGLPGEIDGEISRSLVPFRTFIM